MHFSVLLIHEKDENAIMTKRNYDATEACGAEMEFYIEMSLEEAKKEYNDFIEKHPSEIERFPTLEVYMECEYSHLDLEDGEYGHDNNVSGMYDWYSVGGRWSGILPACKSEKELKLLVKKALNLKNKKIREKYRDNAEEYVRISEMPVMEACAYLQIGGQDSMVISDDISAKDIISWWENIRKGNDNIDKRSNITESMIYSIIIEENGEEEEYLEGDENINDEFFTEKYNYFLNLNKTEGRNFQITILDCHT